MTTKLTIVILNYNTKELVTDLLASIKNSTAIKFTIKVIVIDNASTDDSVKTLQQIKWIQLIESHENLGFARGNNLSLPYLEGEYTWFLNPDTVVEPNAIAYMIQYMDDHPSVGMATPRLELPSGKLDKNSHRGFPTPWNSLSHFLGLDIIFPRSKTFSGYYLGHLDEKIESQVDVIGGSSLLVRTDLGQKIGWWSEDYFMYGEDIDFAYKVKQLGYQIMYVPAVLIHHYHGASSGLKPTSKSVTKASKATKIRSAQATIDAMRIFYRKYYQDKYSPLLTNSVLFAISALGFIRMLKIRLVG